MAGAYRYGFNGKEKDSEWDGGGATYDYGFRIYDPRIARFLSVDPLTKKFPELTPYQFASNTPIQAIDLDGLESQNVNSTNNQQPATQQGNQQQNNNTTTTTPAQGTQPATTPPQLRNVTITISGTPTGNFTSMPSHPAWFPAEVAHKRNSRGQITDNGILEPGETGPVNIYQLPTYTMTVTGTDDQGLQISTNFEVQRFGVHYDPGLSQHYPDAYTPQVTGIVGPETRNVVGYNAGYLAPQNNPQSPLAGGLMLGGDYMIHRGPANGRVEFANLGCIGVCNGRFVEFKMLVRNLAGTDPNITDNEAFSAMGRQRNINVQFQQATLPTPTSRQVNRGRTY